MVLMVFCMLKKKEETAFAFETVYFEVKYIWI